jgi:RHH-type proline utilization regulon transcriptional repressor/proline dehydrogenase/delta 1-pyrroline-5-carboxylate dehydrogenase
VLATGNVAVIPAVHRIDGLPAAVASRIVFAAEWRGAENLTGALVEGSSTYVIEAASAVAQGDGVIVPVQRSDNGGLDLDMLVREVALSINTAAAGGNASLMALAES